MSVTSDLHTYLLAETDITDLVGDAGVYWQRAPQDVDYPFVIFSRIDTDRSAGADVDRQTGYVEARYQFDAYSKGTMESVAIIEAIRTTLGEIEKTTIGSTYVQAIFIDGEREVPEPPNFGEEEPIDRVMIEARIVYNETVPTH